MPVASSFLFHGEVFPFGAQLEGPRVRNVKGALALPRVGGELHVDEGPWDLGPVGGFSPQPARVDRVTSRAVGEGTVNNSKTEVACTIEGLRLPGILKADHLSAEITSVYANGQHSFSQEVVLDGLQLDGQVAQYSMSRHVLDTVQASPSVAALRLRMQNDPAVLQNCMDAGTNGTGDVTCFVLEPTVNNTVARMPLRIVQGASEIDVFVGEYRVADQSRRLTMLRVEMRPAGMQAAPLAAAGPQNGSLVFLELEINGHRHP
ncbi:MAG TPA: hypothetical protein VKB80_34045 [Kofleriaceae bacterium]|nr:hypothetical protein [Kofleriaceae bacterium]